MSRKTVIFIFIFLVLAVIAGAYFFSTSAGKSFLKKNQMIPEQNTSETVPTTSTVQTPPEQNSEDVPVVAIENQQEIKVESIVSGDEVQSPAVIEGEAKANWFHDEKFSVFIWDSQERIIGTGVAQAKGDIDQNDLGAMVPFIATVDFTLSDLQTGYIVLQKQNSLGAPVKQGAVKIPVHFVQKKNSREQGGCRITGCSAQVCADQETVTECSYKEEYICYQKAVCERQADGQCGWTKTKELNLCLEQFQ